MNSIKYINDAGTVAGVQEVDEVYTGGKSGYRAFFIPKDSKDNFIEIDEVPFSEERTIVEANLLKFAQEKKYVPVAVKALSDGKDTLLQGEISDAYDFTVLSDEDFNAKAKEYLDLEVQVANAEADQAKEIKRIKEEYGGEIKMGNELLDDLRPVLNSGCEREKVEASWERDAEAEMMILVRRDNLKPLQIREMTAEEKEKTNLFDNPEEEAKPDEQTEDSIQS